MPTTMNSRCVCPPEKVHDSNVYVLLKMIDFELMCHICRLFQVVSILGGFSK
jgi:hypothetical protein